VDGQQYAADFIDGSHSLTAGFWVYQASAYASDSPEVLLGAIKFRKDNDEIRIKYDSLDGRELDYFAEGLTVDRECEPQDLERFQPLMEAAIKEFRRD
jgi:hypothetical protein